MWLSEPIFVTTTNSLLQKSQLQLLLPAVCKNIYKEKSELLNPFLTFSNLLISQLAEVFNLKILE